MRRPGIFPWMTLGTFAATAVFAALQYAVPELAPAFQREPSMLSEGEIWRFITALLVQVDGLGQIALNLVALMVAGLYVERHYSRFLWALAYVGGGLIGETAGIFWEPVGGGNSVAVLGLVGLGLVHLWRAASPMPARRFWPIIGSMLAVWLTAIHNIHGPSLLFGLILGAGQYRRTAQDKGSNDRFSSRHGG
ncbi:rhomboid family intramembrane serine protease [Devosia rhodophyticola]|uniref:Rhomboid family intramembrane serine protease n=1 Tax=Devosia rhodophyticola TaxID=3026423 RepID=A0ABY7YU72_9HYPH|nr:rhomboid family intramembrane serine protease [Devosia rhodophyticola]WDR04926.1 rhomboid family intramembrane serine protease [Devosia rhodophyticola]